MILAISGGTLFIVLILIAVVLCAYSINKSIKITNRNKQKSQAMMNDLNVFMMTHEASKRKQAETELDEILKQDVPQTVKPEAAKPVLLSDEEKIRIKTLYEDAGMKAEDIAAKIGKDVSLVQELIDKGM